MEGTAQNHNQTLEPEQAAAKAALLAECAKLATAGVSFVAVHFDGCGDDGATEEVKCYGSGYACGEQEPLNYDASHLQDYFEALVPFGYENDCGGFGDVVVWPKHREQRGKTNSCPPCGRTACPRRSWPHSHSPGLALADQAAVVDVRSALGESH
jgi:hypothetical protein